MAQFDIITASTKAYKTCWASRHYLVKLALAPFLIKTCCLVFAAAFTDKGDTVQFLFYMLPALFAEGWMLSHFTRYIVLGQTWPFRPSGDMETDMPVLRVRARGVLSGMIVYVLISMVIGVLTVFAQYYLSPYISEDALAAAQPIPPEVGLMSFAALVILFWGFRLAWLYIPFALNGSAGLFLYRLRGIGTSLHMIGVWILCLLPFVLLVQIFAALIAAPVGAVLGSAAAYFVVTVIAAAVDTAKAFVITAGMTFGIREIYERGEEN